MVRRDAADGSEHGVAGSGVPEETSFDVLILGGGLAGLSLAIQLKRQDPALRVGVLERHAHPVREAAFKVGESTVEIGAHYFADVLGLRDHLESAQLRKFGFRFFFSEGRTDLDACDELGVSRVLPVPSWQIDRGRFENFLGARARALGVDFRDGTVVRGFDLGCDGARHEVRFEQGGNARTASARWLVDASGRAGLIKRKLGLAERNAHNANAVWWRVDGHVDPQQWSCDATWLQRCDPPARWRSTNHLCGPGYWAWLIPLASGAHSVGIVCDAAMHPLETMNSHEKAMAWLHRHQPALAGTLAQPAHAVQDFAFLRDFSYGCRQVFSGDRWALTGEAGVFLDPFYSPGSDFIGIANTYICDLVAKDRAGVSVAPYADLYQQLFLSFYENTLTLYQDQYPLFGNPRVMPLKVVWDYSFYWALLAPVFFAGRLTDIAVLGQLRPAFAEASALNVDMQALLRNWHWRDVEIAGGTEGRGPRVEAVAPRFLDQSAIGWFREMNRALQDPLDDAAFIERIQANVARLRLLAADLRAQARRTHADLPDGGLAKRLDEAAGDPANTDRMLPGVWYATADRPSGERVPA